MELGKDTREGVLFTFSRYMPIKNSIHSSKFDKTSPGGLPMINIHHEQRLVNLLERFGHHSHSHLYYLGDKEWFWDSEHEAVLVYRSIGKRRIVLGDMLGAPGAVQRLLEQFMVDCRVHRQIPVFYQIQSNTLPVYKQWGFRSLKIGEEARVHVPGFHLNGKQWLKLRNRINKFNRNGYKLEVLSPPYSEAILNRLQTISNEWLNSRREKSFSVGSFSPEYVSRFPIAVLSGPDGQYEAFATVAGDHRPFSLDPGDHPVDRNITIDLMRYTKASPHGTMDVLFASLFLWAKEHQYDSCSMGMAPLANMEDSVIGALLYEYGNKLYNFKGLYEYKNKFATEWRNIYLVYPPRSLPVSVMLLACIIHRFGPGQRSQRRLFSLPFFNRNNLGKEGRSGLL
jgi:phosphatidylglycerol lysyltransferase